MWSNLLNNEEFFLLILKYKEGISDEDLTNLIKSIQEANPGIQTRISPDSDQLKAIRLNCEDAIKNDAEDKVGKLKEWLQLNRHLPKQTEGMIFRFLWTSKYDVNNCEKRLNKFYAVRAIDDEIFGNRDPTSPAAQQIQKSCFLATLPILTRDLYRVHISALNSVNPDDYDPIEYMRRLAYHFDIHIKKDFSLGDVCLLDFSGFTLKHHFKWNLSLARKLILFAEGTALIRIKQIHCINCPSYIDKIITLFKAVMKEKMASRIILHKDSLESLYNYLPKEQLPNEYGGSLGPMSEFSARWTKELHSNKEWFQSEERNIKTLYQQAKNEGKILNESDELFGMDGSFRRLNID